MVIHCGWNRKPATASVASIRWASPSSLARSASAGVLMIDLRGVGVGYVQSHIGRFIKQFGGERNWTGPLDMMQACMPAIIATRQYLDQQVKFGFVEGRNWDELAWNLIEFARVRGLPNGVSKSDDPAKASPFVAFVRELQLAFPERFRRHNTTNAALAEAITVARREMRRSLAWRAAQKANSATSAN